MASRSNVNEEYNSISSHEVRKKAKNSEFIALQRNKIDSYILLDLDKILNDVYCSFRPISADYDTRKELLKNLNVMAIDIYGNSKENSPVLEAYGSYVTDTFSKQSDFDVSIKFGDATSELSREKKLYILERFAKKLHSLEGKGIVSNVESIFTAVVPIVKFSDQRTSIECDLSVENKGGILNSQIIRIVSQIDGRFQKLCLLVKHWAKAHEINSALNRTLNSVSITLLVALHLQTQNPSILPPFSMLYRDGINPSNVEKRTQYFLNWGQCNQESLGRLFTKFFIKLQSVEFLWSQGLCVSVLNGLWISKTGAESISVEDFTDVSQNVARRVNGKGAKKIYISINRAVKDIFEFLNGKVTGPHLIHRLFGHQVVVKPPPPVPPLNTGKDLRNWLSRQKAVVEQPHPPVPPLNENCARTDLRHMLSRKRAVMEHAPNGNISGTHLRHRLYGQPGVVQPPPHVPPLNVYPQQPHNSYRNGFRGPNEEHHNNRVCSGNNYRVVEGTYCHEREEERYKDYRGQQIRYVRNYNGFENHQIPQIEIYNIPFNDPYTQVPLYGGATSHLVYHTYDGSVYGNVGIWQDYSYRIGPPQPRPPPSYGIVSYENFSPQNFPQPYFCRSFY